MQTTKHKVRSPECVRETRSIRTSCALSPFLARLPCRLSDVSGRHKPPDVHPPNLSTDSLSSLVPAARIPGWAAKRLLPCRRTLCWRNRDKPPWPMAVHLHFSRHIFSLVHHSIIAPVILLCCTIKCIIFLPFLYSRVIGSKLKATFFDELIYFIYYNESSYFRPHSP